MPVNHGIAYHGAPSGDVAVEDADGMFITVLPATEVARDVSPAGFGWGYSGGGSYALGHSLIAHVLGAAACCPDCGAVRHTIPHPPFPGPGLTIAWARPARLCGWCVGGLRSLPAQALVNDVIGRWRQQQQWRYGRHQLLAWLHEYARGAGPDWAWLTPAIWAVYR